MVACFKRLEVGMHRMTLEPCIRGRRPCIRGLRITAFTFTDLGAEFPEP